MGTKAFGIFEGGGAKGFAHIGALKAAELKNIEFIGVAGASAGSIVAALVAAGYRADDLYNPEKEVGKPEEKKGLFDMNFVEFFDKKSWGNLQRVRASGEWIFGSGILTGGAKAVWSTVWNNGRIRKFINERGFLVTKSFVEWLDKTLAAAPEVRPDANTGRVLFKNLPIPLAVIVTDLTNQKILEFSGKKTPDTPVAEAVAASISIPLVFYPFPYADGQSEPPKELKLVDGGLLSNFPAWVFDEERDRYVNELPPTFGFRLVQLTDPEEEKNTFFSFLGALFSTALSGDAHLQYRRIENLHLVPLKVRANTLDFEMKAAKKEELYVRGRDSAWAYLRTYFGPADPENVKDALAVLHAAIRGVLGRSTMHLRLNVTMPVGENGKQRLKVLYRYNMDRDADDQLEFDLDAGACGKCWQAHDWHVVDLAQAKEALETEYKMNKYQRAMVRPTLRVILCVPIYDLDKFDKDRPKVENPILGVLTVDSDEDLAASFSGDAVLDQVAKGAGMISPMIRG